MKATTIKLEGKILSELDAIKPPTKSLTAFIREILLRDIERRKLRDAGERYSNFLNENQREREWLEDWESVDLVHPPKKRKA
ncbi:MAG TPA: hypothetical protein VI895_09860 [Bdellovibrionota bacterium]|nr:hypothetical protein [Bdellovibrionota bacterium]